MVSISGQKNCFQHQPQDVFVYHGSNSSKGVDYAIFEKVNKLTDVDWELDGKNPLCVSWGKYVQNRKKNYF